MDLVFVRYIGSIEWFCYYIGEIFDRSNSKVVFVLCDGLVSVYVINILFFMYINNVLIVILCNFLVNLINV